MSHTSTIRVWQVSIFSIMLIFIIHLLVFDAKNNSMSTKSNKVSTDSNGMSTGRIPGRVRKICWKDSMAGTEELNSSENKDCYFHNAECKFPGFAVRFV